MVGSLYSSIIEPHRHTLLLISESERVEEKNGTGGGQGHILRKLNLEIFPLNICPIIFGRFGIH